MIDAAVAVHLTSKGHVTYSTTSPIGVDCFLDRIPSTPDAAVGIFLTGGNPVEAGGTMGYDEPVIQIIVRGAPHDVVGPKVLARAIYDELHGMTATTLDPGGADETRVIRILAEQSAPIRLGPDENERHEWSINLACHVRATTLIHRT